MQQTQQKRQCPNCYFSRVIANKLHCVKNPPTVDTDTGEAQWPSVKKDDICGQFRYADDNPIDSDHWPRNELPIYKDRFGDYCKIPLTRGQFAKVDPEDYLWLSQLRWYCHKGARTYYAVRQSKTENSKILIYMHRVIANTPGHMVCDHINHNGLDNRKENLRNCTIKQNIANSRPRRNSTSKYKGVAWSKRRKKWFVSIQTDGKTIHLGYFEDEDEAGRAYDDAAKKYQGEYANLNFR